MISHSDSGLHRAIWAIALPSMLTNVATALFGLADLWVIGQLGQAEAQAGVELGAKFMMGLLVVFNFLRSGTVALTAQASGRNDPAGQAAWATWLELLFARVLERFPDYRRAT